MIVYRRSKGAPLYKSKTDEYLFFALQLWFVNEPPRGGPVAKALAAYLEFLDMTGTPAFPEVRGEWAIAKRRRQRRI